jgi:hypothetical protein
VTERKIAILVGGRKVGMWSLECTLLQWFRHHFQTVRHIMRGVIEFPFRKTALRNNLLGIECFPMLSYGGRYRSILTILTSNFLC